MLPVRKSRGGTGKAFYELALFEGDIRPIMLAGIDLIWPEKFVFPELLEPMGEPTGYPCYRKNWGVEVGIDAHLLVNNP